MEPLSLQEQHNALLHSFESLEKEAMDKDRNIAALRKENKELQAQIDALESSKSIYSNNLEMIKLSVNEDEYKFIEDLAREKDAAHSFGVEPRSNIMRKLHTDAEEEFFLLSVLAAKIDLSAKGCSNASVSDVSPQNLWNRAQESDISMHQFHDWIMSELLKVFQSTQYLSNTIKHVWKSNESVVHQHENKEEDAKQRDTQQQKKLDKTRGYVPSQMEEEEQILTDEDDDSD